MYDRFMGRVGEAFKGEVESTQGRDILPEEIKARLQAITRV